MKNEDWKTGIEYLNEDHIKVIGKEYYSEEYLKEMMRREYSRGLRKGQTIHIAKTVMISKPEF